MSGVGVVEGLGLLRAGLDALLAAGLGGCSDDEVLDVAREVEVARRRLAPVDHRVVCELEVRGTAVVHRARGTAGLLSAVLGVDPVEARARVTAAADLGPRWSMAGEALAPVLPATAAGQARGELSARHAAVIADTMRNVPRSVPDEVRTEVEADLAARGAELLPAELKVLGERVLAHLDPDGALTDDTDRQRRRSLSIGRQGADGMAPVRGLLDPRAHALLQAAFVSLAKPDPHGEVRDSRSTAQRNHDALAAVCEQAMAADQLGSARGAPAAVVVHMQLDDLERRAGTATTATGGTLSIQDAITLAAAGSWALLLMDTRGHPLWLGRDARLATTAQRRALTARDGGCTRPGCDLPAAWCQAHHLTSWTTGGPTDVDNLALVCPFDHHLADQGWRITLNPHTAQVEWIAPPWLDPTQTAKVNHLHHPDQRHGPPHPRLTTTASADPP